MTVLDRIAGDVRARLSERMTAVPLETMRDRAQAAPACRDFLSAFATPGPNIIAEIKRASPSQGALSASTARAADIARDYLVHGAAALSILTEQNHFSGSLEALIEVRAAHPEARLLQKDFVLNEYQLYEARSLGADAVLLIVALLGEQRCAHLLDLVGRLGLTALVEVHDEDELKIAKSIGASLIGVNNRNLKTLEISLETSLRLAPLARGATLICESGLENGAQVRAMRDAGFHGFLIGSAFMRQSEPGRALAKLIEEAR